jgi:probable O-glycosylation ligase (exosortase A-associated)
MPLPRERPRKHDSSRPTERAAESVVSYRDLIVFTTILLLLPRTFRQPFFGLLVFTWLAYMRPQDLCWGFARNPSLRYSFYCAILMYVGWFLYEKHPFTRWGPQTRWLAAFILCLTISLVWAVVTRQARAEDRQIEKYVDLLKVFAVTFFTVGMVDTKERLDKLLWVIALSLGFFGVKCGLHGILRGGRILQGPGGMMLDNNDLCLAMAMNIPLLFFLGRQSTKRWVKRLCWVAVALTCVTVVCTVSRGGFLTMCLVVLLIFNKLKRSLLPWVVAGLLALVTPFLLPEDVKERLATLQAPEEETSAAGRLYAWKVGMRMVAANPYFGVGFEGFLSNFRRYDPIRVRARGTVRSVRVAHNTYVQVWAELGTFALLCFLGMMVSSLRSLRRTRRQAIARGGPRWIVDYANMLEVSLIGFIFGANFLNRAHFDLMYHLVALSLVLAYVARSEIAKLAPAPMPARSGFGPLERPALAAFT